MESEAHDKLEVFHFTPLAADWRPMGEGRPEGLHLSDILYGQMYDDKLGRPAWKDAPDDDVPNPRMQMGFLWERAIHHVWVEFMQNQPLDWDLQVQVQKDGIHMTPDGVSHAGPERDCVCAEGQECEAHSDKKLIECKATWRTLRKWEEDPEEEFAVWFWQVKAYMHALGLNTVQFYNFFVNGDYRYKNGRGPIVVTQEFTFSDTELEDNWKEILAYKKLAEDAMQEASDV